MSGPARLSEPAVTRVPIGHKLLYGMGYLTVALTTDMTLTWLLKRYRPDPADPRWDVLATELALVVAVALGRVVDAVADPLIGYWSDGIRTRWGRRKPFIVFGAPLLALMFVAIWLPPDSAPTLLNSVYLAVVAALFFFAFTVVVCPYLAMLPEITDDPRERVSLASWQGGFNIVGAVAGMVLAGWLIETRGYMTMALVFAPAVLLCAWAPLLVPTPIASGESCRFPLRDAVIQTFRNPLFVPYVVSQFCFWVGLRIVLGAGAKIVEVRAQVGESGQGMVMATALLAAGMLLPAMRRLADRFGKRRMLMAAMVWFGAFMVPLAFVGWLPIGLSPLAQAFVVMALIGPAIAAIFSLPNAMVADIVDYDERLTGERREAIYFGVQGLLVKAGLGAGMGIAAVLLGRLGETATAQGGFIACPLAAMVFAWVAAGVLTRYRGD